MKKNIFKVMAVAFVALFSGNAAAQDGFHIDPIEVEPGSTTEVTVLANLQFDGVSSISFKVVLPEGFTIGKNKSGKKYVCNAGSYIEDEELEWTFDLSDKVVGENNTVWFICYSSDYLYASEEEDFEFCSFNLIADASLAGGEYNLDIIDQEYTVAPEAEFGENAGVTTKPADYNWVVTIPGGAEPKFEATIASSGRTVTYCADKALDFTGVEGLTAYVVAKFTAAQSWLVPVEKVPAMCPVVLEGTAGKVEIPYTDEAVEAPEANLLQPVTEAFTISEAQYGKIWVMSGGKFKKAAVGLNIPVGKAYVELDEATAKLIGDELDIAYGEPTGIETINAQLDDNAPIYNLNGVRVNKLQKGVYIQNGHKFIVK